MTEHGWRDGRIDERNAPGGRSDTAPRASGRGDLSQRAPGRHDAGCRCSPSSGRPNVGKSVLFNALTGIYVTVSNYPGTTVEVSRGRGRCDGTQVGVVDTPGMYRLLPITEEERVARQILLRERPQTVVHVVDAKNVERMLPMTLQLIEAGLPVVLDLNLMDEAERLGVRVDAGRLGRCAGHPGGAHGAGARPRGRGTQADPGRPAAQSQCACCSGSAQRAGHHAITRTSRQRSAEIGGLLHGTYQLSQRTIGLLLLQGDAEVAGLVRDMEGERSERIAAIAAETAARFSQPLAFVIGRDQREAARRLLAGVLTLPERRTNGFAEKLSAAMMRPLTGIPLLLLALYLLYQFVGVLGAQILVKFLEDGVFGAYVNPSSTMCWRRSCRGRCCAT